MVDTEGRQRLLEYLGEMRMSMRAFERSLGVASGVVSRWCSGTQRPDPIFRDLIESATNRYVLATTWNTPEELHARELEREQRRRAREHKLNAQRAARFKQPEAP